METLYTTIVGFADFARRTLEEGDVEKAVKDCKWAANIAKTGGFIVDMEAAIERCVPVLIDAGHEADAKKMKRELEEAIEREKAKQAWNLNPAA